MAENILVISIRPRWVREIISGKKTVELRRRPPRLDRPVTSLIYETSPERRLRARCLMGPVRTDSPVELWKKFGERSGATAAEFYSYFAGTTMAHAIEVASIEELSICLSLERLRQEAGFVVPQSWSWATPRLIEFVGAG